MKRRKIKTKFLLLFFVAILTLSLLLVFKNKDNKPIKKEKVSNTKTAKEEKEPEYELRTGEELVGKSSNNKVITKYMGAYYVDGIMIVNKSYPLDSTYAPTNPYKEITSDYIYGPDYLDKTVMDNYLKMKNEAEKHGYTLKITSGYRSYKVQVDLYNNYAQRDGKDAADTYSARAGHSEHQSGLCFDLNGTNYNFLETEIGKWVNENAANYGFILRFPKDKEKETGYNFEAWHYRYVGVELAKKLYNNGEWITLESYLGVDSKY